MTELRETQLAIEVIAIPTSALRETQISVEVLRENIEDWYGVDSGVGTDAGQVELAVTDSGVGSDASSILKADTISIRPLRIGVVATMTTRQFAILTAPLLTTSRRLFAILGPKATRSVRQLAILGVQGTRSIRRLGILAGVGASPGSGGGTQAPQIGTWTPSGGGSGGGGGGTGGTIAAPVFGSGIRVFDKAGNAVGTVSSFTVNGPRERAIGRTGSMQFYVPSTALADVALLREDRLVAVSNRLGMEPWAGTIDQLRWDDGSLQVSCSDVSSTLAGIEVEYGDPVPSGTPVHQVVQRVIDLLNGARAARGVNELVWSVTVDGNAPGAFREYRGDAPLSGHAIDLIDRICERNQIEWHWRAKIASGGKLSVVVDLSEKFAVPGGQAIFDGPGGNVVSTPTVTFDPTGMVHGVRVVGQRTDIAQYAAPWARWAVKEVQPEAFAAVDPGDYRYREDLDVRVDWSLPKELQIEKARATEAILWQLYGTFLTAFHDQFGRPYHEGFKYQGPPTEIEPFLHTGLGWRTWLHLIEVLGKAASAVMISRDQAQALVVEYDPWAAVPEQHVRRRWFSEAEGTLMVTKMSVHGYTYKYSVQGGVIIGRTTTAFDHSLAILSNYSAVYPWPRQDANGKNIVTYHRIRRVVSITEFGAVTEGMYFETGAGAWGPTTNPAIFTRPTVGDAPYMLLVKVAAPDTVEGDSAFLGKMYDFEQRRIADWDPRRDGIGIWRSKPTVVNNQPSTIPRWHVEPFGEGGSFTTDLQYGISASATKIYVGNAMQVPRTVPFYLTLDREPGLEIVKVTAVAGDEFTIVRGQGGTTAVPHAAGSSAGYEGLDWEGFDVGPYDWPDGDAFAQDLVARLSVPLAVVDLEVANEDGVWSSVKIGSTHQIDLVTEGPIPGGVHGVARVVGYAPDEDQGSMRLVLEFEVS